MNWTLETLPPPPVTSQLASGPANKVRMTEDARKSPEAAGLHAHVSSRCVSQYREQMAAKGSLNKHKNVLGIVSGYGQQLPLCNYLQNNNTNNNIITIITITITIMIIIIIIIIIRRRKTHRKSVKMHC